MRGSGKDPEDRCLSKGFTQLSSQDFEDGFYLPHSSLGWGIPPCIQRVQDPGCESTPQTIQSRPSLHTCCNSASALGLSAAVVFFLRLQWLTCFLSWLFSSGMWYSILEFLNVAGVVTNSFLVAFTSSYGRSWEGDLSTSNRTDLVFNSTSNTTETVFIVTEHLDGPSKLWLIIGFEVSPPKTKIGVVI